MRLCLMIGGLAGFVVMAVLLAPFFRKFGAFTVPSYLGPPLRKPAAAAHVGLCGAAGAVLLFSRPSCAWVPFAAGWLVAANPEYDRRLLARRLHLDGGAGGMRSFTWSGSAQSIAAVLGAARAATIVSVMVTNLPLPQLTNGPMLRALLHNEVGEGLQVVDAWRWPSHCRVEGFAHSPSGSRAVRRHRPDGLRRCTFADRGGNRLLALAAAERRHGPQRLRDAQVARLGDGLFGLTC